jgi:hypothetical protein
MTTRTSRLATTPNARARNSATVLARGRRMALGLTVPPQLLALADEVIE